MPMEMSRVMQGVINTSRAMAHSENAANHLETAVSRLDSESPALLHLSLAVSELIKATSALAVNAAQMHSDINALADEAKSARPETD